MKALIKSQIAAPVSSLQIVADHELVQIVGGVSEEIYQNGHFLLEMASTSSSQIEPKRIDPSHRQLSRL